MFRSLTGYFSNDLAIDLGTANTLIYMNWMPGNLPNCCNWAMHEVSNRYAC